MMRLFRNAKGKVPPVPSINECITRVETIADEVEQRIAEIDAQLRVYKDQMEELDECPTKRKIKVNAMPLLKRKKQWKNQAESLRNHSHQIKQTVLVAKRSKNAAATSVPQCKKNNFLSEKLRSLYKRIVKQSK